MNVCVFQNYEAFDMNVYSPGFGIYFSIISIPNRIWFRCQVGKLCFENLLPEQAMLKQALQGKPVVLGFGGVMRLSQCM